MARLEDMLPGIEPQNQDSHRTNVPVRSSRGATERDVPLPYTQQFGASSHGTWRGRPFLCVVPDYCGYTPV